MLKLNSHFQLLHYFNNFVSKILEINNDFVSLAIMGSLEKILNVCMIAINAKVRV